MSFESYLAFFKKLVNLIPFNVFDYGVIVIFLIYVFEDASFGLIPAGLSFFSIILSFLLGLAFYHPLSKLLIERLAMTKGMSDAASFFLVSLLSYTILSSVLAIFRASIKFSPSKKLNALGGAIFGSLSFFFIASFAIALFLSLPIPDVIKDSIQNSVTGRFLSARTQVIEGYVRQIFGGAIEDSINFLTIKPDSTNALSLNFRTSSYQIDLEGENEMLVLINRERVGFGLLPLDSDARIRIVAREHAKDMLERGYFSHYTPEGLSPFDRMEEANVIYQHAGENLAFAQNVDIAMNGFMKSASHRANILSKSFTRVGIAVVDAGFYGKIFVQEFTD